MAKLCVSGSSFHFMKNNSISYGPTFIVSGNKLKLSHVEAARSFVNTMGVSWDANAQCFLHFDKSNKTFQPISILDTKELLVTHICAQAKKAALSTAILNPSNAKLNDVLEFAKSLNPAVVCDANGLLPVANGVVRFGKTKVSLLRHNAKYGLRHCLPYDYDPNATCPRFDEMVQRVVPDDDDRRVLQMYLGGPLTGLNQTRRMLWMHGPAGTSKSTILNIQEAILGRAYIGDLRTGLLESRFEKSHLIGKRQLSAKDVPANFLKNQGAKSLKHLVGGDGTQAEVKFGGKVNIHGNFFVVMPSNGELRLSLEGDEEAWMERLIVLDFAGNRPTKLKANFADVLLAEEGSGILRWMIEGGMMYLTEVRKYGDIRLNRAQKQRIEGLVLASKSLEVFASTKVGFIEGQTLTNDELIRAYSDFCKKRAWEPVSSHVLYSRLPDLMLHEHGASRAGDILRDGTKHKGYRNVILLPR